MMKVLEYYSVPTGLSGSNHSIDHLYYIARQLPEDLPETVLDLLTWQAAYDVCLAMKDGKGSEAAKAKMIEVITNETI